MCQALVNNPYQAKPSTSYTRVVNFRYKILRLRTKTRLLKEAMGVDLLVWIVGYKLSRIYNIP